MIRRVRARSLLRRVLVPLVVLAVLAAVVLLIVQLLTGTTSHSISMAPDVLVRAAEPPAAGTGGARP